MTFQEQLIEGAKARLEKYRAVEAELEGGHPAACESINKLITVTEQQIAELEAFRLPPLQLPTPRVWAKRQSLNGRLGAGNEEK